MAIDPETLPDDPIDVPPPFEGEQTVNFDDYDLKTKPYGFWVCLQFSGQGGERASWTGNLYTAPDTDGRKKAHAIAWRGLREFFKAMGMADGDIQAKPTAKWIAQTLDKYVTVNGNPNRVHATVTPDGNYMNAGRFKAA